jgi:hypothetical protein
MVSSFILVARGGAARSRSERLVVPAGALALLLLCSCLQLPSIPDDTAMACADASECPPERRCNSSGFCVKDENVPPAVPIDLQASAGPGDGSLLLRFTAPGDDGTGGGSVARYEIVLVPRPEAAPILRISDRPPGPPGSFESLAIDGLSPATAFTVQLVIFDDADNSARSGILEAATAGSIACDATAGTCLATQTCGIDGVCVVADDVAPGRVSDIEPIPTSTTLTSVTIRFTAPGDDGFDPAGAATRLAVHVRPQGSTRAEDEIVVPVDPLPGLQPAEVTVAGLERGTIYDVRVDAIDDAGNASVGAVATVETGGVACRSPGVDGTYAVRGDFAATRDDQLLRLMGCEVIDGSLDVDARDCAITSVASLSSLRVVTGTLLIGGHPLCATSPTSIRGLEQLMSAGSLIFNQIELVDATLPALQDVGFLGFIVLPMLKQVAFPALTTAYRVELIDVPALESIATPVLGPVGTFTLERSAAATLVVDADAVHIEHNPALVSLTVKVPVTAAVVRDNAGLLLDAVSCETRIAPDGAPAQPTPCDRSSPSLVVCSNGDGVPCPCAALMEQVCGGIPAADRCSGESGCAMARSLWEQSTAGGAAAVDIAEAEGSCTGALADDIAFAVCEP